MGTGTARYADLALYRRLLREARPYWPHVALLFLLGLLAAPLALLAPLPLKTVVDSVLGSHPVSGWLAAHLPDAARSGSGLLLLMAVLLVGVTVLAQLRELATSLLRTWIGERMVLGFRARLFSHVQRLSLSYHDAKGTSESVYRIQYDSQAIQELVIGGVVPFVTASLTLILMLWVAMRIDWQLAAVALTITPVLLLLLRNYRLRLREQSREVKRLETTALSVVQEVLSGLRVVRAFGREEREQERFVGRSSEGMRARISLALVEHGFGLLVTLTTAGGTAAVLVLGAQHVRSGALTLGELLLVMAYLAQIYEPIKTISRKVGSLQSHLASAERAFSILDTAPDVIERTDALPLVRATGAVTLHHVSFAYGPDPPVLRDVSLEILPGSRVGIIGTTGAGKTTLVSLLARFYDPTGGQILLDGIDLRDYRLADVRNQLAMVLQDTVLFSTSVAENIAYARPGASEPRIVAAAQAAGAHEFILHLPQGYETQVGERGMRLSGGQRQRIALARAFLRDAPILVLDEPTSSVDLETEAVILKALDRLMRGRTVFLITHRPSALAGCDVVLRIEGGVLVEEAIRGGMRGAVRDSARIVARDEDAAAPVSRTTPQAVLREDLANHPAVRALRSIRSERLQPEFVHVLRERPESSVYRLSGVGDGGTSVIAKRYPRGKAEIERIVYEDVLPHLPVTAPAYYGCAEGDGEFCWLFLEDVGGERYSTSSSTHSALAGRWLGLLHVSAAQAEKAYLVASRLQPAGPHRYLGHLRSGRDAFSRNLSNPLLSAPEVEMLRAVVSLQDGLETRWNLLEEACAGLPSTLVHGDFRPKNAYVREDERGIQLLPIDWEMAGWGSPAADLTRIDLGAYASVIRKRWRHADAQAIERMSSVGRVFQLLAAIDWVGLSLGGTSRELLDRPLSSLSVIQEQLSAAARNAGF